MKRINLLTSSFLFLLFPFFLTSCGGNTTETPKEYSATNDFGFNQSALRNGYSYNVKISKKAINTAILFHITFIFRFHKKHSITTVNNVIKNSTGHKYLSGIILK